MSLTALLVTTLACSGSEPAKAPSPAFEMPRAQRLERDPGPREGAPRDDRTLLVFIMDTVRADRTTVCGHPRPTTPHLAALAASGAQVSCEAISTGSWTHPGHAGILSGLSFWEHGAHRYEAADGSCLVDSDDGLVAPLQAKTFLDELQSAGWRTVCVVENKLVSEAFGLTGGCGTWIKTPKFASDWGPQEGTVAQIEGELAKDDPRPVALFVNVMDAHQRLHKIPADHPWLPQRSVFPDAEAWDALQDPAHRQAALDLYDYGVWRADAKLGGVLESIERERPGPLQVLVTTDHGEMLGDGALSHGNGVWDPLVQLPVVAHGFEQALPKGPFSSALLHDLVLGEPLVGPPPRAASTPTTLWQTDGWGLEVEVVAYEEGRRIHCTATGCTTDKGPLEEPALHGLVSSVPRRLDCALLGNHSKRIHDLRSLGYIE